MPPRLAPGIGGQRHGDGAVEGSIHVAGTVLGLYRQDEGTGGGDGGRWLGRHHQRGRGLDFEGADVDGAVYDPRETGAALVSGQGLLGGGIDGQGIVALVDGRAAVDELDGLGRAAIIRQRFEPRVDDADLVATDAIGQAARAAGADQVERTRRGDRAGDIAGRCCAAGANGVQREDRVFHGGRARGDIQPTAGAAVGRVVVSDGGVDNGQRTTAFVDAAAGTGLDPPANRIGVSVGRVVGDGGVSDGHRAIAKDAAAEAAEAKAVPVFAPTAELLAMVELVTVIVPSLLMPPPSPAAWLLAMVESVTVSVPPSLSMPPPWKPACCRRSCSW